VLPNIRRRAIVLHEQAQKQEKFREKIYNFNFDFGYEEG